MHSLCRGILLAGVRSVSNSKTDGLPQGELRDGIGTADPESARGGDDYTFRTGKKDRALGVKSFLGEINGFTGNIKAKILYVTVWCRVLSLEQLRAYSGVSEDDRHIIDNALSSLVGEGYLTEIGNRDGGGKYYCLSENGLGVIEKIGSVAEFRRRDLRIPKTSSDARVFADRPELIRRMVLYNEISLRLYDREIMDAGRELGADTSTSLVNLSDSGLRAIFSRLTIDDRGGSRVRILIVSGVFADESGRAAAASEMSKSDYDFLLYVPYRERAEDMWKVQSRTPFNTVTCYIAGIGDGDGRLNLTDRHANMHSARELIQKLNPEKTE